MILVALEDRVSPFTDVDCDLSLAGNPKCPNESADLKRSEELRRRIDTDNKHEAENQFGKAVWLG